MKRFSLSLMCPDGRMRRASYSPRALAYSAANPMTAGGLRCRVQANGLSVYGRALYGAFMPGHNGAAFYGPEGRQLVAEMLAAAGGRALARAERAERDGLRYGRTAREWRGAAVAAVRRAARFAGLRGRAAALAAAISG